MFLFGALSRVLSAGSVRRKTAYKTTGLMLK